MYAMEKSDTKNEEQFIECKNRFSFRKNITTMNLFFELKINDKNSLMFFIPSDLEDKLNHLFYPTEQINLFDVITIVLKTNDMAFELAEESIDFTIGTLYRTLKNIHELPTLYKIGDIARIYNLDVYNEKEDFFNNSWIVLWSNQHTITHLYSQNGKVYMDISPMYPWLYEKPDDDVEDFFPFEDYIRDYKPIQIYELSQETIDQWRAQCSHFLKRVEKPAGLKDYDSD